MAYLYYGVLHIGLFIWPLNIVILWSAYVMACLCYGLLILWPVHIMAVYIMGASFSQLYSMAAAAAADEPLTLLLS